MVEAITVLIADDHPFMRKGIRAHLVDESDITIVGEAHNGDEAIDLTVQLCPDILLLDLRMPGKPASSTVSIIRSRCRNTRVLMLTACDDQFYVNNMISCGVAGYILKDDVPNELVKAVRTVATGGHWLSNRFSNDYLYKNLQNPSHKTQNKLTDIELSILQLLAKGFTNNEIAEKLLMPENIISGHLKNICNKLGADSRVSAVICAVKQHVITLS